VPKNEQLVWDMHGRLPVHMVVRLMRRREFARSFKMIKRFPQGMPINGAFWVVPVLNLMYRMDRDLIRWLRALRVSMDFRNRETGDGPRHNRLDAIKRCLARWNADAWPASSCQSMRRRCFPRWSFWVRCRRAYAPYTYQEGFLDVCRGHLRGRWEVVRVDGPRQQNFGPLQRSLSIISWLP
jgi:hypothetical protein